MQNLMTVTEINALIARYFDSILQEAGFHARKARSWIRAKDHRFYDIVQIEPLKGAAYTPMWGVSLPYVPHISGHGIRWHTREQSAQMDVSYRPLDEHNAPIEWVVPRCDSPSHAERLLYKMAANTEQIAFPLLSRITSPETALVALRERQHAHYEGLGFSNWAQHPISLAFTLRKVGYIEEAFTEFEQYVERNTGVIPQHTLDKLRKAFYTLSPEE